MFVTVFLQILSLAFASLRVRVCLKLLVLIFKMESAPAEKNQFFVVQKFLEVFADFASGEFLSF